MTKVAPKPSKSTRRIVRLPKIVRSSRFDARLPKDVLDLVKRAAHVQGRSLSDFVVTAAAAEARRVISETDLIRLSQEASFQVAASLLNPPEPNAALRKAFTAKRRLIRD